MSSGRFSLLTGIFLIYSMVCFGEISNNSEKQGNAAPANNGNLHLEVKEAPIDQVFKIIESQAGIQLHVSSVPQKLVTATCTGTALEVLKCALGNDVNLIYQYSDNATDNSLPQLATVWVLGASSSNPQQLSKDSSHASSVCSPMDQNEQRKTPPLGKLALSAKEIEGLFKLSQSDKPADRKEALSRLALVDQADDGDIREIMKGALQDQSVRVREQAISGLARRNSPDIESVLNTALQDRDSNVRLMAVSNAGENVYVLQSALNDRNSDVRALARMKLNQISAMSADQ
ncbi:hypothetical conserved protein [Candidatus Nitrosoglobus terrae]|uniref:Hypothetical conserved protein n=1 Tax=Candidatus Nitrosoglobus terrae TaxID=1630141 RepID=A0A1Q2SM00_9GAMM|nr:HEAT repeat domain-containing protein [Candidatus Nitrosoglobus terrae]BAW80168.1 hypothetical conserved protein [Candidatus Nitrosoglobus terrae]